MIFPPYTHSLVRISYSLPSLLSCSFIRRQRSNNYQTICKNQFSLAAAIAAVITATSSRYSFVKISSTTGAAATTVSTNLLLSFVPCNKLKATDDQRNKDQYRKYDCHTHYSYSNPALPIVYYNGLILFYFPVADLTFHHM